MFFDLEAKGAKKIQQAKHMSLWELDDVAVAVLDDPDSKVNTLNSKLMPEFDEILNHVDQSGKISSLIIISAKKDCFVAGADIEELAHAESEGHARELSQNGQKFFDRIDAFSKTVIAAIDGACLGGGLELALSCDFRIATDSPKTQLGLPEVMLGLLPGAGGTQRLPRLIGLEKSLNMILTGQTLRPVQALKLGLVDHVTTQDGLFDVAVEAARRIGSKSISLAGKKKTNLLSLLEKIPAGRDFIFKQALKSVVKKTRGLYPAPKAIINVLSYGLEKGLKEGLKKEAEEFGKLSQTSESKGLISIYFAQNELKKNRFGKPNTAPKNIGVIGSGLMGAGISLVSVQKGFHVRMKDVTSEQLTKGVKYVWDALNERVKRKSITAFDQSKTMSLLHSQLDYKMFQTCDVVIEAVFEDLKIKHKVLQEVEAHMNEKAVFASNTSALPITEIAKASRRPERVVGMHYFSPVHKMPLLEIIITDKTADDAAAMAVDVGMRQGKTVIVVKDGPGFYTTRILAPYMDEAAFVCEEGIDFNRLDSIMKDFGFPVGPMTLMDEVGIDVAYHVGHDLGKAFGARISSKEPKALEALMASGSLGKKSKKGFFIYPDEKKPSLLSKIGLVKKPQKEVNPEAKNLLMQHRSSVTTGESSKEDIQKRLAYRMINEAVFCLQEGILSKPVDGDIGAIFGLGFPPFLGGPFRYMDQIGLSQVIFDLKRFADTFGPRFEPCSLLVDMEKSNRKFYD